MSQHSHRIVIHSMLITSLLLLDMPLLVHNLLELLMLSSLLGLFLLLFLLILLVLLLLVNTIKHCKLKVVISNSSRFIKLLSLLLLLKVIVGILLPIVLLVLFINTKSSLVPIWPLSLKMKSLLFHSSLKFSNNRTLLMLLVMLMLLMVNQPLLMLMVKIKSGLQVKQLKLLIKSPVLWLLLLVVNLGMLKVFQSLSMGLLLLVMLKISLLIKHLSPKNLHLLLL